MTSDRPYSAAVDDDAAIAELLRCSGTQFDPDVVEACVEVLAQRRADDGDPSLAVVASLPQPGSAADPALLSGRRAAGA